MFRDKIIKYKGWYIPEKDKPGQRLIDKDFQCTKVLPIAMKRVNKFKRAIDVGTWIGDSTKFLAERFDEVIGFEASELTFNCCVKNLQEQKINNVTVNQIGLSNSIGVKNFYTRAKSTSSAWFSDNSPPKGLVTKNPVQIQTTTLDELMIENVDFIKIDVDSHEGFVIAGGLAWLQKVRPVVMIECKTISHNRQNDAMPDPRILLNKIGYKMIAQIDKADYLYVP